MSADMMDRKGRDVPPREFLPKMCNSTLIRRKPSIQIEGHSQYLDYQAMNVSITQDRKFQTDGQVQCVSLTWRKPCSKGDYWENVTTKAERATAARWRCWHRSVSYYAKEGPGS